MIVGFVLGFVVALAIARVFSARTDRALRSATSVFDALRHHDYGVRARVPSHGAIAGLLNETNALASHLADERSRANEASTLLELIVRRMDVALLAFDEAKVLQWWNPAAERALPVANDLTADELAIADWLEGPSERPVIVPGGTEPWELRRGVFHQGGKRFHYVLLASLQRIRREEERSAWQRLLRVIGHEVNNTLAPVSSLAATSRALLQDGERDGVLRALEVIEQRAGSLGTFIAEYARLARLPEPQPTPIALVPMLARIAAMDGRREVRLIGTGDLVVSADAALLEQALVNLVRNAIDAASTVVTIDWRADERDAHVLIADDGAGIENPDNLFVPLFSTKPGGSGIGLVLARNIVEAHGGRVGLANRATGTGCIASVSLPLSSS